jgi:hypothetical protein
MKASYVSPSQPLQRPGRVLHHVVQDGHHALRVRLQAHHHPQGVEDVRLSGLVALAPVRLHGQGDGVFQRGPGAAHHCTFLLRWAFFSPSRFLVSKRRRWEPLVGLVLWRFLGT